MATVSRRHLLGIGAELLPHRLPNEARERVLAFVPANDKLLDESPNLAE